MLEFIKVSNHDKCLGFNWHKDLIQSGWTPILFKDSLQLEWKMIHTKQATLESKQLLNY
jgi:hypothetical protein